MTGLVISDAFIDIQFTIGAIVTGRTFAGVLGNAIDAVPAEAGIGHAFVDIYFTIDAFIAFQATADVSGCVFIGKGSVEGLPYVERQRGQSRGIVQAQVGLFKAKASKLTRLSSTFGNVFVAVFALVAWETVTGVVVDSVHASGIVGARL